MKAEQVGEFFALTAPLAGVPGHSAGRSNVLQFASRHPGAGMSPVEALRRVQRASLVVIAAVAALAVVVTFAAVPQQPIVFAVVPIGWLCVEALLVGRRQDINDVGTVSDILRRHLTYGMAVWVAGTLLHKPDLSASLLILVTVLAAMQMMTGPLLRLPAVKRLIGITAAPSVLVVADRSTAVEAVEDRAGLTTSSVVGVCLVEGSDQLASVAGVPVLGSAADVVSIVASLNIHEVAVRLETPLDNEWLRELEWSLEELGARLTLVTRLKNTRAHRVRVSRVGSSIVLGVSRARPTGVVRNVKAAVEIMVAAFCFVLTLPLLVACAVAVKLDSPGPALFRQSRVRDGDRTFTMLKLRTMSVDAEERRAGLEELNEVGGGLFKMRADPRITRVGRILRKLSLDELPQLVNVMRGEMSLIGPRPALPSEVATYDGRALRRLGVKPGLTGLWQVSGRSALSWDEAISLDIDYVDNWSAGRDLRIAFETIRAVASKNGAY